MYKIDALLKLDRKLYHTRDLALLWNIRNANTLYTTIARYVRKGILIPIHKGFYSTVPPDQLDPYELGAGLLHAWSYVSCETVLFTHGVISQAPQAITLVSSVSRSMTAGAHRYLVRRMKPEFLHQPGGITQTNGVFVATLSRAIADVLYFHPRYHFDAPTVIDWSDVNAIQKEIGFV